MHCPTAEETQVIFASLGYKFVKDKYGGFNIVGWRSKDQKVNEYNDVLAVYWQNGYGVTDKFAVNSYPITTMPGLPYLSNPINPRGTAILVPGQYTDCYSLGTYKFYTALRQVKPVSVYRDNNKNNKVEESIVVDTGLFGIHIHKGGFFSQKIGKNSAGCQVFQKSQDFNEFINLCEDIALIAGNKFTYTLVQL